MGGGMRAHTRIALMGLIFLASLPFGNLLFRFVFSDAVGFLNLPGQVFALTCNHIQMIIGKLAPLLFDIAFELLPVSFDTIPVHFCFLCVS